MSEDEGTSSAARGCVGGSFTSHDPSIEVSPGRVWVWFFLWTLHSMHFPCVFSRFIVLGRVRIRRTWTLARARSNREIARDPTTSPRGRWPGWGWYRYGSRLVV